VIMVTSSIHRSRLLGRSPDTATDGLSTQIVGSQI
jgi:hypothetical protein